MHKAFINIFILYLLFITFKPCGDDYHTHFHSPIKTIQIDDIQSNDEHSDYCSPFCCCSCCNISLTYPKYFHFEIDENSINLTSFRFKNICNSLSPPVSPPPKS